MVGLKLPKEDKERIVDRMVDYFEKERGEELGRLAALDLLEMMLKELGPYAYNEALKDARAVLAERLQSLEDELYALEKRPPR